MPTALRQAGATVRTMADVYGELRGQALADEAWLEAAGDAGWVVLMKDTRIRYRPAELAALQRHRVRAFCVTNGNLRGAEQAERFVRNLDRIRGTAAQRGPYIYGVYENELKRIWPSLGG